MFDGLLISLQVFPLHLDLKYFFIEMLFTAAFVSIHIVKHSFMHTSEHTLGAVVNIHDRCDGQP